MTILDVADVLVFLQIGDRTRPVLDIMTGKMRCPHCAAPQEWQGKLLQHTKDCLVGKTAEVARELAELLKRGKGEVEICPGC